ncbi:hypothetical protein M434DRAFT_398364 [Hypoxylon sp. CO27-5]|nr:hypothetical protein M434DRAFT_398364 [Hypoxylon sp. CO27-5]
MGLFNRHHPDGAGTAPTNGHRDRHVHNTTDYSMAVLPSFGQWLKVTWLDILTMICMGALGLGIYEAKPAPTRSFPVTFSDGEVVYPEFAYPLRKEIVPIWLAAFLASVIPIVIILFMQIRIRSFWDANNAIIGLLYSLITAAVFQVFLKWLIGGLRPHFLSVCKPDVSLSSNAPGVKGAGYNAAGFTNIYYTSEICTGDENEIDDSLESFPSGHSTAAWAGFFYLYLYLNAKLKVFANYHPAMIKLIAIYAPVLGATLISGALTIDEFHNWYDVVAGAIIGTVMALSAYRMCYASIFDWRFNHIPLSRGRPFSYTYDGIELMDALWTRKAGWGTSAANGGHTSRHGGATGFTRKPVGSGVRGDEMV